MHDYSSAPRKSRYFPLDKNIAGCFTYASTYELQEGGDEVKQENRSVVFTVRWCRETAAVTSTGYRIRFRGEVYSILSVDPMHYQTQGIKPHCRKEAHP